LVQLVTQAEAKIHRVGPRHTIYLAKDLVEDSTFPFQANEDLTVRIEGNALIIDKTGKSSYRLPDMEALPSRNQHVMETLDNLNFSPIASKAERIRQMLSEIHEAEMLESRIRHMPKSEHAILLWEEKSFLDIVLSEFFDPGVTGKAAKGLLSAKPANIESVSNLLLEEVSGLDRQTAARRIRDWMLQVHSTNKSNLPTRIAVEDYSWLLQNGTAKGLLEVEQDIGLRVKENMTILCGYDVSNVIDPKQLDKIMGFHGYAIVDHPFRVYRRAGD